MAPYKILIVDDETEALENCRRMLAGHQYECLVESDPRRALDTIERNHPQVLLTDLRMPGLDGIGLLQSAKRLDPGIKVVLLTAYASVQTAVLSMRHGAFDYLAKPFSGKELRRVIGRAMGEEAVHSIEVKVPPVVPAQAAAAIEPALVGQSRAIQSVRAVIDMVAKTEATVLLLGERGTGKERIARVIHAQSPRASKPFVPVDCEASDDTRVELELFGADPSDGRETVGSRPGLLESAHGGTLFLDEVGQLSLRLQAKLLRVFKERQGRRANGTASYHVDVRVIAASTEDLLRVCQMGQCREDFYQYLSIVPVSIPPVRQRSEDIELLTRAIMESVWRKKRRGGPAESGFTADAMGILHRHAWPGNLRELQHVIERAAILAGGGPLIDRQHLPDHIWSV